MELALYCPDCGYYEKDKDIVGKRGDFYTSVSTGSLFGELLAFQFAQWLEAEAKGGSGAVRIVEAGAHEGRLAADILKWLRDRRNEAFAKLEYWIVEPSARRRGWQQENLSAEFREVVRWVPQVSELKSFPQSSPTIIFSNELLDAMPVHRLAWDAKQKKWFECGVTIEAGRFAWHRMATETTALALSFQGLDLGKIQEILPDSFVTEVNPSAENWWREAARILKRGKLITIDYGLSAEEFFVPERREGTLRAYRQHRLSGDFLSKPGEQDITAHVNFSVIQRAGEAQGLRTEALVSQTKFLTAIAQQAWQRADIFGDWNPARSRQFQTLTHPEHLGRSFRVLIQSPQPGDSPS